MVLEKISEVINYKINKISILRFTRQLGLVNGIKFYFLKRHPGIYFKKEIIEINPPKIKYPVKLRKGSSDIKVFEQIFLARDYDLPVANKPQFIIDGGANVGFATVFFANKFPEAKIIAVEPEVSNFEMLIENTSKYKNVEARMSALWNKNSWLKVKDVGHGKYGFIVEEVATGEEGAFQAITLGEILANSGYREIDILKLDIEGSEKEVFSENQEQWLGRVKVLIIELHDVKKPGCSEAFYAAVAGYGFIETKRGENIVLFKA